MSKAMERRIDPYDGKAGTLAEMMRKYHGEHSDAEMEAFFFNECAPVPSSVPGPERRSPCKIAGLEEWLRDSGLEQYREQIAAWCAENGAVSIEEIEENLQEIKAAIMATEIDPGDRVRVEVLQGKWKGQYVAVVLGTTSKGIRLRHEEDDYEEELHWSSFGAGKYRMEPASEEEEDDDDGAAEAAAAASPLRLGRLRVDPVRGAGLELRWVKMGYCVDSVDAQPGQPDLRAGDAIVACGGAVLAGLGEDEVEACFGKAFADGACLVAGTLKELMRQPIEVVRRDAERLTATI